MTEEGFPRGRKKAGKRNKDGEGELTASTGIITKKGKKKGLNPEERKKEQFLKLDKKLELPSIGYDTLVEGTLCLGCVRQVRETQLLVGLPGMTAGIVDIQSISTPYSDVISKLEKGQVGDDEVVYPLSTMFSEGDVVVVKVMNVVLDDKNRHKVTLSLNPREVHGDWMATDLTEDIVLTGAVKSKEDKGYIIDVGIKGVSAFLPSSSASMTEKKIGRPFGIGQLVSVNIMKCEIKRLMAKVTLSSIPSKVKLVCPPEGIGIKYLPGMRVPCIVVEKRNSGLMVNFLDTIGRVHNDHLGERHRADVSDTVMGRILFIPPWDVGPYLTFDEANCFPYSGEPNPSSLLKPGDSRRRKGFVTTLEPRGAKIKLHHSAGMALLKRQKASDKLEYTDDQFKQDFKVRSEHEVRILEYSALDRMFIVSTQEHLMAADSIVNKDELKIGTMHKVVIVSYNQGGAIVKVGEKIKGFIPYMHFKDKFLPPQVIQKKYPTESKLGVKVFQIDTVKNSIVFTAKKTLRMSQGLVAGSYADIEVGATGHGIVRFIAPQDKGIRIQMIGGLLGFAPKGKIPKSSDGLSLSDKFPLGLPVAFKVIEVDQENGKAILTLDMEYEIPESKQKQMKRKLEEKQKPDKVPAKKKKKGKDEESKQLSPINKEDDDQQQEEEEIPKIPPSKRKAEIEKKEVASKRKKLSKAKKSEIEVDSDFYSKLDGKNLDTKKENSEDSGIEDETSSALKLATKSFWDIVPDQNHQSDSSHVKVEKDTNHEGKGASSDNQLTSEEKKKKNKVPSLSPAEMEMEDISEKEHELRIIQNPSDPKLWRSFKDFLLKSGDPAKAVSIIKRMKDKIPFRDEKGKLLCWLTVLQIEIQYGTESSVKSALDEALKVNDPMAVLQRTAQFYESIDKIDDAEQLYRRRLKMEPTKPESWLDVGLFLYKNGKTEGARYLLPSALKQLSESNQIYVTAKFAKMEIELGDIEKGRSMFLTICLQRPKRTDLWLLYANSLYKMKHFQLAADALRSALGTKNLTPKECKPLLKRLVEIEKAHGSKESLLKLKAEAADYLNLSSVLG